MSASDLMRAELLSTMWKQARTQAALIAQRYATEAAERAYGDALSGREADSQEQTARCRLIARIAEDIRAMEYEP